jgi:hypothetical protein
MIQRRCEESGIGDFVVIHVGESPIPGVRLSRYRVLFHIATGELTRMVSNWRQRDLHLSILFCIIPSSEPSAHICDSDTGYGLIPAGAPPEGGQNRPRCWTLEGSNRTAQGETLGIMGAS